MLTLAIALGIYSYGILLIGLLGVLKPIPVFLFSITTGAYLVWKFRNSFANINSLTFNLSRFEKFIIFLIGLFFLVGLVGILGPEIGFDALWYHLTIPKIFIQREAINFIEGNFFYYSLLPKLTEMLYIPSLMLGGEFAAKLVHFIFSVMTSVVLYKLIRLYLARKWALLGILIFNSNLVVAWLATSSYIDLTRAFYETISLFYILKFSRANNRKYLFASSILLGFAVAAKIVSLISLPVFVLIILFCSKKLMQALKNSFYFVALALLVPLPWFLVAYYYTKNPFYPIFSNYAPYGLEFGALNPFEILQNLFFAFLLSSDPINPIYFISLPLLYIFKSSIKKYPAIIIYVISSIVLWYLATYIGFWHATDQAGGSRFLTAYLPGVTLLTVIMLKKMKVQRVRNILVMTIVLISISTIIYRTLASLKYVPVIIGIQTKQEFLMNRLNFDFGDFYDEDEKIRKIVNSDKVLIVGIHNLYYADFKFTLPEWSDSSEAKYMLIRTDDSKADYGKVVYQNAKTNVKLYKL